MLSFKRTLSLILALCVLLCCFPAATLAESWQAEHPGGTITSDGFITTEDCAQFTRAMDAATFGNARSHFLTTYYLSGEYLDKLLSVGSYSEQCAVVSMLESFWGGSCFGIASTMALNRMSYTDTIAPAYMLDIQSFDPGADNYAELPIPRTSPSVLDMINYYQIGQRISTAVTPNTISVGKIEGDAGKIIFERDKLRDFVSAAKADIDADKPFLFSISSSAGGHALLCVDYYEYDENGVDSIIFKLYDENCAYPGYTPLRWYSWIKLQKAGGDDYLPAAAEKDENGNERIIYHKFDGTEDSLSIIRHRDIAKINETLSIHNPQRKSVTATNALLTCKDINNTYARYAIKPVKTLTGGIFGAATHVDQYGVFRVPGDGRLPFPANYTNTNRYFPYMNNGELLYHSAGAPTPAFTPLDVQLSLKESCEGATFAAYDVVSASDMDIRMSKMQDADNGQYAEVAGRDLRLARFEPDGALRYLKGPEGGQATDVALYFGAQSANGALDMFRLNMARFGYLKIYGAADPVSSDAYANSVVLHSDGFPFQNPSDLEEIAMGFTFYKGSLISDTIKGGTDTDADTWIKIKSEIVNNKVQVSVWTDSEPTPANGILLQDGTYGAAFDKAPDYTTILHERPTGNANASSTMGGAIDTSKHYGLLDAADGLTYQSGSFRFRVDAPFHAYVSTSVDGVMVEREFVKVEEGSTIVTIDERFMQTLKDGEHKLRVQFTDGAYQGTFTKGATLAAQTVVAVPATGGAASTPIVILAAAAALLIAVVIIKRRK
ncbi:MAG: hypothetical protein PHC80_08125 [Eubacteriales bacterium]|nr:hypothetical protein [Eubacteriales bacterium]